MVYCFGAQRIKITLNDCCCYRRKQLELFPKQIADWNEHTAPIYKELNLLQIEHMYTYALGNVMFSQYIGLSPYEIPPFICSTF